MSGSEMESYRRVAGLSQAALGEILGVSAPTVNRWEKGDQDIPGPADKLLRMLIRGEMPVDLPTAGLGSQVREDIGAVEMTVEAFEECVRRARAAGFASVTEWIAALVRAELQAGSKTERRDVVYGEGDDLRELPPPSSSASTQDAIGG